MKLTLKASHLKYLILGAGGLGLALRLALYATGIDGRNLLVAGHWASVALVALTIASAAAIFLFTRTLNGPTDHETAYPVSFQGAIGAFAAMLGIAVTSVSEFSEFSSSLHLIVWVLGVCSAISFGCIGVLRLTGGKSHPLLHALPCIYFALRMVSRYQLWSSDPQLQDYSYYLLAYVALMLTAYHHAAFDADMGAHRSVWRMGLASVYLCTLSLSSNMDTLLLLGCCAWAFTNLTNLTSSTCRQCPALTPEENGPQEE